MTTSKTDTPIYCYHEPEPVCPWCGERKRDAWELNLGDGEEEGVYCDSCGKLYNATCHITTTYDTKKVDDYRGFQIAAGEVRRDSAVTSTGLLGGEVDHGA